ncbi:MAG: hypothetical protein IPK04_15200 [Bdellovibrionales bacterium]|nr:hypothetical protein [Bdellovibrionales bacterium]
MINWTSRSGSLIDPPVLFLKKWPATSAFGPEPVMIFDKKLLRVVPGFREWVSQFRYLYPVEAGESLKAIEKFPSHMTKMLELTRALSPKTMSFVAIGGGSLGDFVGFVASLFKRGVTLYQIPSTWLAAIDSSHGGKTALNVGTAKNQIGTFYGAAKIFIVKPLLLQQPQERVQDGLGEMVKISLIDGGEWTRSFFQVKHASAEVLWKFLPAAIASKYRVIRRDPFETRGDRQILNLGHTLGHLFEVLGPYSHGIAVGQGLFFALEWSYHRGYLTKAFLHSARVFLEEKLSLRPWPAQQKTLGRKDFHQLLLKDKKREKSSSLQFIFLRGMGRPLRKLVTLDELTNEAARQGILKAVNRKVLLH